MNRRKAKEARLRELKRKEKDLEEKRLADNFERLKTMTSGLLTGRWSGLKEQKSNVPKSNTIKPLVVPHLRVKPIDIKAPEPVIQSKQVVPVTVKITPKMSPEEYARREAEAQVEIAKKRKRTGVLYNKGAYQFISDEMDITTLGRK